jgi:hypothetical protein
MDHPTPPDPPPDRGRPRRSAAIVAGIASDPELSLAAKGVLLVALTRPAGRPLARAELLERCREARWLVDAALAELTETRWLRPAGAGRFALHDNLRDDPDQDPDQDRAR